MSDYIALDLFVLIWTSVLCSSNYGICFVIVERLLKYAPFDRLIV
jgi:hypothetical protein